MAIPQLRKKKATIKGGEIISKILAAEGVDTIFGIVDGSYFGLYSTFRPNGINLITPRHESNGVHMAGAYARLTGKPGVCIASNGPGVANVLSGVALENAEGNRILLITSTRRQGISYPDRGGTFQYFPQVEATRPMTKWNCAVPSVDRIAEIMQQAFRVLFIGRPGIVHVDVPENIMSTAYDLNPTWLRVPGSYRMFDRLPSVSGQVQKAADMLAKAEFPMIHAGTGIIHAQAFTELQKLAILIEAPITTSLGGRACVNERLEQVIPIIYPDTLTKVRNEADLVLTLGSRLGETDGWGMPPYWASPGKQKMIQVDIDPAILGCNKPVDVAVQADIREFLRALIKELEKIKSSINIKKRKEKIQNLRNECDIRRKQLDEHLRDKSSPLNPAQIPSICQEVFDDDAIVAISGGYTSVWCQLFHQVRNPQSMLDTSKMDHLGAAVPQVIGAKAAHPDRQVYGIIGDGAMSFNQKEIETAIRNNLAVIYLVLCDKQWDRSKMNQLPVIPTEKNKSIPDESTDTPVCETRYDLVAQAMGAFGERVSDPAGLKSAIKRALDSDKCSVIHVDVSPEKHIVPDVPLQ